MTAPAAANSLVAPPAAAVLQLDDVAFRYEKTAKTAVLENVRLALPAGGTVAVLGLSGSGKTTLLHLLGLLWEDPPERGTIRYWHGTREYPYADLSPRQAARLRLENFGFVLQTSYLLPHFSCGQNIAVPLALKRESSADQQHKVDDLLGKAGLRHLRDRSARELSGGEKQRIALLRAIVHDPHVLFADEPVSNLDIHNAPLVLELLKEWKKGDLHRDSPHRTRTLILVSHDIDLAWDIADGFVLLHRGRVVKERLLTRQDLPGGPAEIARLIKFGVQES